ncbi:hypothetical protein FACS189440_06670 [Bacteroidia bacterium]|nr:hypothetical protein FACS189440_06670 [Bacteroidia bacterium]
MNERVTFYVDGFNFYYGLKAKKKVDRNWQSAYWIDIVKLFSQFLSPNQTLEKVIYFTASPLNQDKSNRQGAFLNVNKLLNGNKFEVVRGKYLKKIIQCPIRYFSLNAFWAILNASCLNFPSNQFL